MIPLFGFGPAGGRPVARPLVFLNGTLILDSGESDGTFLGRCQDRYMTYAALAGWRSVVLVRDGEHRAIHEDALARLRRDLALVERHTSLLGGVEVPRPLYVCHDLETLELYADEGLARQLREPELRAAAQAGLWWNQVSPISAQLHAQLAGLLREAGLHAEPDLRGHRAMAALAMELHDKARYVELVRQAQGEPLPPHVQTVLVDPSVLLALTDWDALRALLPGTRASALFVKSAHDSGGNLVARIDAATFDVQMARLRAEVARHVLRQGVDPEADLRLVRQEVDDSAVMSQLALSDQELRRHAARRDEYRAQHRIRLLVQPAIEGPAEPGDRPLGMGFSYEIRDPDRVRRIAWAGQVYTDPDRKEHLGASLQPASTEFEGAEALERQLVALCRQVARRGYRGPVSFDGVLDGQGQYRLIYDCNPRMTAILPALVVARHLDAVGIGGRRLVNFDYRGRYALDDPARTFDALRRQGLLLRRDHPRGVLLLPNIARHRGWDALFVGLTTPQILGILEQGVLGRPHDAGKGSLRMPSF